MAKYIISQLEVVINKYAIEADSKEEALDLLLSGGTGDFIGQIDGAPDACTERGISLEEAKENGIDVEKMNTHNIDWNGQYIPSIYGIKEEDDA